MLHLPHLCSTTKNWKFVKSKNIWQAAMCRSACKRKGENDMPPLSGSWANALKGEFSKDYYKKLFQTVGAEYKTRTI